jgi:predicted ester cyclase
LARALSPARVGVAEQKRTVRQWVDAAINEGDLDRAAELSTDRAARLARSWVPPFRAAFPDVHMEEVELIGEGETIVGRFTCSATHLGEWRGKAPTGRRFEDVDEVYFFRFDGERISDFWGIEDTASRLRQLGLTIE